ncbi:MAG TPA: TadE family type IV pilus minor pilin [Actinomycetales bacterium]|nr:TadE family type IV pilus minor pilin [Actinomycetales bacterium]
MSPWDRGKEDRGAVTIEFAIALVGIVAILAAVLLLLAGAITAVRSIDAAHAGARMTAIGEPRAAVQNLAIQIAGGDANVSIRQEDKWVSVTVRASVPNSPWPWQIAHTATAYVEPSVVPAAPNGIPTGPDRAPPGAQQ